MKRWPARWGYGAFWALCAWAGHAAGAEVSHDDVFWESVAGCTDAVEVEMYLDEFPRGRHAREARACLERLGVGGKSDIEGRLELCEVHFEANRLTTGTEGTAVACYEEVLSEDPGNPRALEGLRRVLGRYAEWAQAALGRAEVARARGYLRRMEGVSPAAAEVEALRGAIEEWERASAEERRKAQEAERQREAGALEPFGPHWIVVTNQPCQVYNFSPKPGESVTWTGACVAGKASGMGKSVWRSPAYSEQVYEGGRRAGKAHGSGTYSWGDGRRYEGQWLDGKAHGYGIFTSSDGEEHAGRWRAGCYEGEDGRRAWVNTTREACGFE